MAVKHWDSLFPPLSVTGGPWNNVRIPKDTDEKINPELSAIAVKDIDYAAAIATYEVDTLKKLYNEVGEMGFLSLFWDSKVPEKDKTFFNLISMKSSNREFVRGEIVKYKNFYQEMGDIMRSARSGEAGNFDEIDELIGELFEKLKIMLEEAESAAQTTDSKALFEAHKDFVSKHDKLENRIRRVESGILRLKQKELSKKWENSMEEIAKLTAELRETTSDKAELKSLVKELREELLQSQTERKQILKYLERHGGK